MPDLNKQTLINLLIDSPLREPIKINLIDIVNNTKDEDLPKTFSTIQKELEIYTKATARRLKLAEEISSKLQGGSTTSDTPATDSDPKKDSSAPKPITDPTPPPPASPKMEDEEGEELSSDKSDKGPSLPPPTVAEDKSEKEDTHTPSSGNMPKPPTPPTSPPSDPTTPPATPTPPQPIMDDSTKNGSLPPASISEDEEALAEIQKELNALKNSATMESSPTPAENTAIQGESTPTSDASTSTNTPPATPTPPSA